MMRSVSECSDERDTAMPDKKSQSPATTTEIEIECTDGYDKFELDEASTAAESTAGGDSPVDAGGDGQDYFSSDYDDYGYFLNIVEDEDMQADGRIIIADKVWFYTPLNMNRKWQ